MKLNSLFGRALILTSGAVASLLVIGCGSGSSSSGIVANDGGAGNANGGQDASTANAEHDAGSASAATNSGDAAASLCTTLEPAIAVTPEADASEPPPASGGTIADGTYHLTHAIFYRRSSPPAVKLGATYRVAQDVFEMTTAKDPVSGKFLQSKARMKVTADGKHLELTECLCGGCVSGVGFVQPYSVVGNELWIYERDTDKGGGGDLRIEVYQPE